jgi:hypothetical protein
MVVFLLVLPLSIHSQAKPVLWPAWNRLWVFKTWREYFRYRCVVQDQ